MFLLLFTTSTPFAQFRYVTTPQGTVTILGYNGATSNLIIPEQISGFPVTSVESNAFRTLGFQFGLRAVTVPDSVTNIGEYAFFNLPELRSVSLGEGLQIIGDHAFRGCRVTNLIIPGAVTKIGEQAFAQIRSLTNLVIPLTIEDLGERVFGECPSLQQITAAAEIPEANKLLLQDGVLFRSNTNGLELVVYPPARPQSFFVLSNNVVAVGPSAFHEATNLAAVFLPEGLKSIGDLAFWRCESLTNLVIPSSVRSVGRWAFGECPSLTNIQLPDGLETIQRATFFRSGIREFKIPASVTSIAMESFYGCENLIEITIPASVRTIGEAAFYECINLQRVDFENGITNIDGSAFAHCAKLTALNFPDSLQAIRHWAFHGCGNLKSATFGTGLTYIENDIFFSVPFMPLFFKGNAPQVGDCCLSGTVIYYLPGTTGWGPSFGPVRTVLWDVSALLLHPDFGIQEGKFTFNITGTTNLQVVVEASQTLEQPLWSPIATNILTQNGSILTDPEPATFGSRIYRLRPPVP